MFLMGKSKGLEKKDVKNEELVVKLRNGDISAINTIILNHVELANAIAFRYFSYCKGDINNLRSAAFFGLVYGVHRAKLVLLDNNITPYLTMHIHKAIYNEIVDLHKNCLASVSLYKKKRKDPDFTMHKYVPLKPTLQSRPFTELELKDEIISLSSDDLDSNILDLKIQGFKNYEIAAKLDINVKTVTRRQQDIEKRWREKHDCFNKQQQCK